MHAHQYVLGHTQHVYICFWTCSISWMQEQWKIVYIMLPVITIFVCVIYIAIRMTHITPSRITCRWICLRMFLHIFPTIFSWQFMHLYWVLVYLLFYLLYLFQLFIALNMLPCTFFYSTSFAEVFAKNHWEEVFKVESFKKGNNF